MKPVDRTLETLFSLARLRLATVADVADDGTVRVAFEAGPPRQADIARPVGGRLDLDAGDEVVVLLRDGDEARPVIVSTIVSKVEDPAPQDSVAVRANREIVLECGEASITLEADGRIVVRGGYVETYAEGTNRIKGAQVRIN